MSSEHKVLHMMVKTIEWSGKLNNEMITMLVRTLRNTGSASALSQYEAQQTMKICSELTTKLVYNGNGRFIITAQTPKRPTREEVEGYWYGGTEKPLHYDFWFYTEEELNGEEEEDEDEE